LQPPFAIKPLDIITVALDASPSERLFSLVVSHAFHVHAIPGPSIHAKRPGKVGPVEQWKKGANTMSLTVKSRKLDSVVIVDMEGKLTAGEPQLMLRETVRRFIDAGNRRFVLNLSDVNYIDSSGLGELAATRYSLAKNGGHVNLLGLTKRVKDLMVMTHLALVFDSFDEESKAVTALTRVKVEANGAAQV